MAAVRQAIEIARRRVDAELVHGKDGRDFATGTDLAVEALLAHLLPRIDRAPVIGEEGSGAGAPVTADHWLVDPLCGTRNFAFGLQMSAINVARVADGEVVLGVVGDPSTGLVYVAERGAGSSMDDGAGPRAISVTASSGVVVVEDSHAVGERREQAALFLADVTRIHRWDLRSLGSTIALAHLAAGRIAAYALFWTSPVHAAAGSLVASEAGAIVTDLTGRPWSLAADSIVAAATPELHGELMALLR